jgi:nucleotide-binding universal stress UspA family protein
MKILIATDGSEFSQKAIETACMMAAGRDDVAFRVISVYEPQAPIAAEPYAISAEYIQRMEDLGRDQAEMTAGKAVQRLREKFPLDKIAIDSVVKYGRPAACIVEEAEAWKADLIVAGSHGHGFWGRLALGSVSDAVLHQAPCSVLVAKSSVKEAAMAMG